MIFMQARNPRAVWLKTQQAPQRCHWILYKNLIVSFSSVSTNNLCLCNSMTRLIFLIKNHINCTLLNGLAQMMLLYPRHWRGDNRPLSFLASLSLSLSVYLSHTVPHMSSSGNRAEWQFSISEASRDPFGHAFFGHVRWKI